MIEKHAKTGDFIQIMRDGGSYYGVLVEIDMPWLAFNDATDGDLTVIWCKPGYSFIFGELAKKNFEKANETRESTAGAMSMLERAISQARSQ